MNELQNRNIVPVEKDIVVNSRRGNYVDPQIVSRAFYNSFGYSIPSQRNRNVIGITSPNPGEGKTLVASNLATSFAQGQQLSTVLVDLNFVNPALHKVFGTDREPGLIESFQNGSIYLSRTKFDYLYVLTAGRRAKYSLEIDDIASIRNILRSLVEEFEFVILDMGSVLPIDNFPVLFVNELDGLFLVVDTKQTKYGDIEKVFRHINEKHVTGFIFNRDDNQE